MWYWYHGDVGGRFNIPHSLGLFSRCGTHQTEAFVDMPPNIGTWFTQYAALPRMPEVHTGPSGWILLSRSARQQPSRRYLFKYGRPL
jgi:hypothetical protein